MNARRWQFVRICLLIGAALDLFVGLLCLFVPWALGPLLDFPANDPALAMITGGELIVASLVYVVLFNNPRRFQPLFFVVALDQFFAVIVPAIAMLRGLVPVTWKTAGPLPFDLALCALFVYAGISKGFADRREDSRYR
jgi:hypothetical protein